MTNMTTAMATLTWVAIGTQAKSQEQLVQTAPPSIIMEGDQGPEMVSDGLWESWLLAICNQSLNRPSSDVLRVDRAPRALLGLLLKCV